VAVTRSRSTVLHQVARLRSFMVTVQPPLNRMGKKTMPLAWLSMPKCSSRAPRTGIASVIA
jgi:hypothetical protein